MNRMRIRIIYLSIIFLEVFLSSNLYSASIEKIFLNIGETKKIDTPYTISVSKKGIIDILEEKDFYIITGLKSGIVMITAMNQEEVVEKKYLIEVKDIKISSFKNETTHKDDKTYSRICSRSQIKCNNILKSISGTVDDIELWKEVKKYCIDNNYNFNLKLSSTSFFLLLDSLEQKLSSMYQVKYVDQNIYIVSSCKKENPNLETSKSFINYITNNFVEDFNIPVICQQNFNQYFVTANIVLIEEGFIKDYKIKIEDLIQGGYSRFYSFIKSHLFTQKIHLVGEPSLYMSVKHKASIHSGGEFQYKKEIASTTVSSSEKDWKQTGMKIDLEILQEFDDSVKMDIDLSLITKDASSSTDTNLHSNSLTSQIRIPLNETKLIGTTDVIFKSSKKNNNFIFQYIPVLSSFFTENQGSRTNNKLFLWLTIKSTLSSSDMKIDIIR